MAQRRDADALTILEMAFDCLTPVFTRGFEGQFTQPYFDGELVKISNEVETRLSNGYRCNCQHVSN